MPDLGAFQAVKRRAKASLTKELESRSGQHFLSSLIIQRALHHPAALTHSDIRTLQRTVGNQAVQRIIRPTPTQPTSTPQTSSSPGKLRVGPAHDKYEQEADMRAQAAVGSGAAVQRTNSQSLSHAVQPNGGPVDRSVEQQITQARGSGRPLDVGVRRKMEDALGMDLAQVRVHTDNRADQINRQLTATASTLQRDIFFRKGAYQPHTTQGQQLLAHELTHVAQQTGSGGQGAPGVVQRVLGWTSRDVTSGDVDEPDVPDDSEHKYVKTERGLIKHLCDLLDQYQSLSEQEKTSEVGLSWLQAIRTVLDRWFGLLPSFEQYEDFNPNYVDHFQMLEAIGHAVDFEIQQIARQRNSKLKRLVRLDGGKMGGSYKARKGFKTKVWKPDPSSYNSANAPRTIGIEKWGSNLSARSVATSDVDKALLGKSGVVARTKFGVHKGRVGQIQNFVKGGKDLKKVLKSVGRNNSKREAFYKSNWKVLRDLQHLQMIDYITGQVDRHWENIMITKSGAVGIDSDYSFGKKKSEDFTDWDRRIQYGGGVYNKGLPQFITKEFARNILRMDEDDFENLVKSKMLPEEVETAKANLQAAKDAIEDGTIEQLDNKASAWLEAFDKINPQKSYLYGYKRSQQLQ